MYFPALGVGFSGKICSHRYPMFVWYVRWYVRVLGVYIGVNAKAFHLGLALSSVRVSLQMNKEEFVEILARSQEKILEIGDLKRSISADQAECVNRSNKIDLPSGKKVGTVQVF